jgi:hypothetical protein
MTVMLWRIRRPHLWRSSINSKRTHRSEFPGLPCQLRGWPTFRGSQRARKHQRVSTSPRPDTPSMSASNATRQEAPLYSRSPRCGAIPPIAHLLRAALPYLPPSQDCGTPFGLRADHPDRLADRTAGAFQFAALVRPVRALRGNLARVRAVHYLGMVNAASMPRTTNHRN